MSDKYLVLTTELCLCIVGEADDGEGKKFDVLECGFWKEEVDED